MTSQVPWQPARGHQWQDAPKLTARVLASQRDTFTAVFFLQRPNPAGALVDNGVWMTRQERFPPCISAQVDRDHAESAVRLSGGAVHNTSQLRLFLPHHEDRSTNTSVQLQGRRKSPKRPLSRNHSATRVGT